MHHERVNVIPEIPRRGSEVSIKYKGILFENGADAIWMHYGFDDWSNATDLQMEKQHDGFYCKIKAEGRKDLNLCFKDSADHWDNNMGINWNITIR